MCMWTVARVKLKLVNVLWQFCCCVETWRVCVVLQLQWSCVMSNCSSVATWQYTDDSQWWIRLLVSCPNVKMLTRVRPECCCLNWRTFICMFCEVPCVMCQACAIWSSLSHHVAVVAYYTFFSIVGSSVATPSKRHCIKLYFGPHCSTMYVDATCCYRPSSVVCRSVCHSSEPCKMADPNEMLFGLWAWMGSRNHIVYGSSDTLCEGAIFRGCPTTLCRELCKTVELTVMPFGLWAHVG